MSVFWNLVFFEYKKILHKKSVRIALFLAVIVTAIGAGGTLIGSNLIEGEAESNYDVMVKDRSYLRAFSGREIDAKLIMEAVQAYSHIPPKDRDIETSEYQDFARPYSEIYSISRTVFSTASRQFNMEDFQVLTAEQANQFYVTRHNKQVQLVEATNMGDKAKEKVLGLDAQIKIPFTFYYTGGYSRFFALILTFGLIAAFVTAICVAPLFAGEYSSGVDQLILASKHGKNKLIAAKLFTGFSLAAGICLTLIAVGYYFSVFLFGFDGSDAPFQLYRTMSPYPLNMGQIALLITVCTFFACLMTAAITMLLSARLKSPFSVIILVTLLLITPMLIYIPETNIILHNLVNLLPINMMALWTATGSIQYELFGLIVSPYVFLPVFASVVSIFLTPFAYLFFKNHQVV